MNTEPKPEPTPETDAAMAAGMNADQTHAMLQRLERARDSAIRDRQAQYGQLGRLRIELQEAHAAVDELMDENAALRKTRTGRLTPCPKPENVSASTDSPSEPE